MKISKLLSYCLICIATSLSAQIPTSSSNLPILSIQTEGNKNIPNEPKIAAILSIFDTKKVNSLSDTPSVVTHIGIETRGNTSQQLSPKKPFSMETRDSLGENNNISLLGLPKENDWVLIAPYSDKSLIRDALAFRLAQDAMQNQWSPRYRFCEVFVNKTYQGVYILVEKIKQDKNRVNIAGLKTTDLSGDDLTGGYILSVDKATGGFTDGFYSDFLPTSTSNNKVYYQYIYPEPEDIAPAQKEYIKKFINDFEKTVDNKNYLDLTNGYYRYVDLESFANYFLMCEVSKNIDAYRISTYLYKDKDSKGGKLKMGPVWDYNIAFGNANYYGGDQTRNWIVDFNNIAGANEGWKVPFYWEKLMKDIRFKTLIKKRWKTLRAIEWSDNKVNMKIDSMATLLDEAQKRNFQQWNILSTQVWPNAFVGKTYAAEINYLKTWVKDRMKWMDEVIEVFDIPVYDPQAYFKPRLYPNPIQTDATLELYARLNTKILVNIFDMQGRLVDKIEKNTSTNGITTIDVGANLDKGMYFYVIYFNGEKEGINKFLKL